MIEEPHLKVHGSCLELVVDWTRLGYILSASSALRELPLDLLLAQVSMPEEIILEEFFSEILSRQE